MKLRKLLCSLLTASTTIMGFQSTMVSTAFAASTVPACSTSSTSEFCTGFKVGGVAFSVPKMHWDLVSKDAARDTQRLLADASPDSRTRINAEGNTAASVLTMQSGQVASAVGGFSSNVPFVVARYEPTNKTLTIDIYKLERLMLDGKMTNALYHSTFAPAYGDYWKAKGSYLSQAEQRAGNTVGPNPFAAFATPGADTFSNISLKGAMVAVGHAQRYVGAPTSLLINYQPIPDQYTKKSGNVFIKKTTTYVDTYAKPQYYIGAPASVQGGLATSYCANDPSTATCSQDQIASSGVTFQRIEGGNMLEEQQFMSQWSHSVSGLGLLAVFVIAFVVALAFILVIGPLLLAALPGAVSGALTTASTWLANTVGLGSFTFGEGVAGVLTQAAVNATITTGLTAVKGSGFNGTYGGFHILYTPEVAKEIPTDQGSDAANEYRSVMAGQLKGQDGRTVSRTNGDIANDLAPVSGQILGDCPASVLLANCGGRSGVVPRADQYNAFSGVDFVRDNGKPTKVGGF